MIAVTHMDGRRAAVFGLGGSGLVTAHALTAGGCEVVCYDDKRERVDAALDAGLPTGDLRVADFRAFDALILSPGVPLTHPEPHWTVLRAKAAGIEIIGDVELFDRERRMRLPHTKLVAITGTNGKSTTTALAGHLLREMGVEAQIGGNIGRPALDLDPFDGVVVLEVSSFQIDLSPTLAADVGVLLNITSDHLDRHGTFAAYAALKMALPGRSRIAVIGHDCAESRRFAVSAPSLDRFGFAVTQDAASAVTAPQTFGAVSYAGGVVVASAPGMAGEIFVVRHDEGALIGGMPATPALRGEHNAQNVAAALTAVLALGLDPADALPHLRTFAGLPHRIEEVGRDGDVVFINDSKATNLDSAVTALRAFTGIHWIIGGRAKPGGLAELDPASFDIRRAYLIGEASDLFADQLAGKLATHSCGTLDAALAAAADDAAEAGGGVVLLSPACASFDQFRSFEDRGDTFRALVIARTKGGR